MVPNYVGANQKERDFLAIIQQHLELQRAGCTVPTEAEMSHEVPIIRSIETLAKLDEKGMSVAKKVCNLRYLNDWVGICICSPGPRHEVENLLDIKQLLQVTQMTLAKPRQEYYSNRNKTI